MRAAMRPVRSSAAPRDRQAAAPAAPPMARGPVGLICWSLRQRPCGHIASWQGSSGASSPAREAHQARTELRCQRTGDRHRGENERGAPQGGGRRVLAKRDMRCALARGAASAGAGRRAGGACSPFPPNGAHHDGRLGRSRRGPCPAAPRRRSSRRGCRRRGACPALRCDRPRRCRQGSESCHRRSGTWSRPRR